MSIANIKKPRKKGTFIFQSNQYIHGFNIFTIDKFIVYNVYIYMYNVGGMGIKLKKRVFFLTNHDHAFYQRINCFNRAERKIVSPRINNE